MNNFTALEWIVVITIAVFLFLVLVYITRAIFSISKHLRNQEATIEILIKMAQKQGVTQEEIKFIREIT